MENLWPCNVSSSVFFTEAQRNRYVREGHPVLLAGGCKTDHRENLSSITMKHIVFKMEMSISLPSLQEQILWCLQQKSAGPPGVPMWFQGGFPRSYPFLNNNSSFQCNACLAYMQRFAESASFLLFFLFSFSMISDNTGNPMEFFPHICGFEKGIINHMYIAHEQAIVLLFFPGEALWNVQPQCEISS